MLHEVLDIAGIMFQSFYILQAELLSYQISAYCQIMIYPMDIVFVAIHMLVLSDDSHWCWN